MQGTLTFCEFTGMPNSNRCVEVEVLNRFLRDFAFSCADLPFIEPEYISNPIKEIIHSSTVGNEFSSHPMTFYVLALMNTVPCERFRAQQTVDRGDVENWPVELLHPCKMNVRINKAFFEELYSFFEGLYGASFQYLLPRITKYGRCKVNGQTFSSALNCTDRGCVVKSMFTENDESLSPYFGNVSFYFKATVVVDQKSKSHILSYIQWYKFKSKKVEPLSGLYTLKSKQFYQTDRIMSPRRFLCRCVLAATKPKAPYFFVSQLPK